MKARHLQHGFRTSWGGGSLVIGVLAAVGIGAFAVAQMIAPAARSAPSAESSAAVEAQAVAAVEGVDFIAVAEDEPWMAAVAAPLAARLGGGGRIPLVVAMSSPPTPEAMEAIRLAAPRRLLLLTAANKLKLSPQLSKFAPEAMAIGADPVQGSFATAKRFWDRPKRAVVAADDDAEGIVLGAALAARRSMPLLLRQRSETRASLAKALAELGVEEVLAAVSDAHRAPAWASSHKYRVQLVPPRVAQDQMIAALGAKQIHTIVVARAPEKRAAVGTTAWLAPYWGLVRGAPVLLTHAASAAVAEADVGRLVRRHGLQPRTITVLADYDSIGDNFVEIENDSAPLPPSDGAAAAVAGKYKLDTEPFVPTEASKPASFGVGRIPLQSLADASVLFARGLLRQRMAEERSSPVLLIANSGPARRPLPLCEAISRVTAEEFKNCGFTVDEFYGKLADSPEVLAAAKKAGLILYEGHLAYQDLFDVPSAHRDTAPDSYFEEELDSLEGGSPPAARRSEPRTTPIVSRRRPAATPQANSFHGTMAGLPIVVLQSCDSLDERRLVANRRIGRRGAGGKRDADPQRLGQFARPGDERRDLVPRGESGRIAPRRAEFLVLPRRPENPPRPERTGEEPPRGRELPAVGRSGVAGGCAAAGAANRVAIVAAMVGGPVGDRRARSPPSRGPQREVFRSHVSRQSVVGHGKAGRERRARRVTPVYFFRTPLPDALAAGGASLGLDGPSNRLALRIDPLGKSLYLVFLPEVERAGETIALRWGEPRPPGPRLGRAAK